VTDKQLQRLKRAELLELLLEIEEENETLAAENRALRERLESREIRLRSVGSVAEAAVSLSGVFDAAQRAADLYLENVRSACTEKEAACERRCRELVRQTEQLCRAALPGAPAGADALKDQFEKLLSQQEAAEREHD